MAPVVIACLAVDRHRVFGEDRGSVKKRPMVLAAIEAVTKADAVWESGRRNADIAAQTTAGDGRHRRSLVDAPGLSWPHELAGLRPRLRHARAGTSRGAGRALAPPSDPRWHAARAGCPP